MDVLQIGESKKRRLHLYRHPSRLIIHPPRAAPRLPASSDLIRGYLKQCREEVCARILEKLYLEDGSPNKWWMCFSKRQFMGIKIKPVG